MYDFLSNEVSVRRNEWTMLFTRSSPASRASSASSAELIVAVAVAVAVARRWVESARPNENVPISPRRLAGGEPGVPRKETHALAPMSTSPSLMVIMAQSAS